MQGLKIPRDKDQEMYSVTGAPVAAQGRSGEESCVVSEHQDLPLRRRRKRRSAAAWIHSDYTRAAGGCQRRGCVASCLNSDHF